MLVGEYRVFARATKSFGYTMKSNEIFMKNYDETENSFFIVFFTNFYFLLIFSENLQSTVKYHITLHIIKLKFTIV